VTATEIPTALKRTPPRSPWREAWKRLRKHKLAVVGLWIVAVVAFSAIFAKQVAPFDPETQERWWGRALPPGTRHLDLRNEIVVEAGRTPRDSDVPEGLLSVLGDGKEHVLDLDVQDERISTLRVVVDGGLVQSIGEGGKRHERIDVAAGEIVRRKETREETPVTSLVAGQPVPAALGAGAGRSVVMLEYVRRSAADRHSVQVKFDGTGAVVQATQAGKPAEGEVRVPAVSVVDARLDGERLEHTHPLGTDQEGRDTLSRVIFGGRISLLIGLVATLVSLFVGVLYGAVSGYAGGRTDALMMRAVDVLYALPYMFLVILLVTAYGRSLVVLFAALGLVQWLTPSRVVRGQILSLRRREFVEAATTLGTSRWSVLMRHLIPNTLGIVVVYTSLTIPAVILEESFLSFIGLSVLYDGRPLESWGALVDYGRQALPTGAWWLLIVPATAMSVTLLSLNFLGDGLRDALDPQQRGRS
jgi:oligopeptide transport system permease protein